MAAYKVQSPKTPVPYTGVSDYKVSEKTAYKVQVPTFWVDCKVKVAFDPFFFAKFWVFCRNCTFWVAYKVQVNEKS